MPTAKLKDKAIAVPDEVLDELGLDEGIEFDVLVQGDVIVLKVQEEDVVRHPEIDAALEVALKEVEEGLTIGPFETIEKLREYLKKNP
jgi:bifunctional DNA-binding transcriptional regulator/antitoxin component of YhaV-PrlF toxin-antitoxin module